MRTIDTVSIYKGVAVVAGPRVSFLDHIMPLVHQWNIPLVCTDPWVYSCAEHFYPPAEIIFATDSSFQSILSSFATFITVEPCRLHSNALQFGTFLYQGKGETVAGFHGNPCKFRDIYWIERYADEDVVLIYGPYLRDYLEEKGVLHRLKNVAYMGNIRHAYYNKHKNFFDLRAKPHFFPQNGLKTIFWAPTWSYPDKFDPSFLFDSLPDSLQMLVKFHPYMFRLFPEQVAADIEKYSRSNLVFLNEIPLVYPFLTQADYFLGDYSSVVYDFLALDRPVFLSGDLRADWATALPDCQSMLRVLNSIDTLSVMRKKAYNYIYSPVI